MERSWYVISRVVQFEMAALVAVVLVALALVTMRIARDPTETMIKRRAGRSQPKAAPGGAPAGGHAAAGLARGSAEWLDRLLAGQHAPGSKRVGAPDPVPDRHVA
jgi:hypothetical protein